MLEPLYFKWEWDLNASPLQLWPFISDTNRFNRDAGLPSIEAGGMNPASAGKILRARAAGMLLEWEEKPFEWIAPFEFGVERFLKSGPVTSAKIKVRLRPHPRTAQETPGTHLIYESWVTPRHFAAKMAVSAQMNWAIYPKLDKLIKKYSVQASGTNTEPLKNYAPLKSTELAEFSKLSNQAAKLASYIESSDDLDLVRIRPYALAREWGLERREMLEIFLTAAHQRILEFQWEIICPHCRGSEKRGPSLEIISQEGYCQSCDLHYTVNFDQLVELTFRPNPRVRKISAVFFCTGGPKITPHIAAQQTAEAGKSKKWTLVLEPGLYRVRGIRTKMEKIFSVTENSGAPAIFKIEAGKLTGPQEVSTLTSEWEIENTSDSPFLFALEHMKWAEDRVAGSDVIHMRLFRDLFQTQCLRPNQTIASSELTIVFTDLRGSTKIYQDIGDPTAFGHVMKHFDILQDIITAHDGTLIKTIGDSVMAVFDRPAKALLAMASAQKSLAKPPLGKQFPLYLKIGIHKGANLMVNMNNRLDYFGSAVNIASRLVSLSSGEDMIVSSELAADPETSLFLNNPRSGFHIEKIQTTIKGFGKENFTLFRIISR